MTSRHTLLAALLPIALVACGDEPAVATSAKSNEPAQQISDHDAMGHDLASVSGQDDRTGHATGVVVAVARDGETVTIDHGPFGGGFEMGAMTMAFGRLGGVELSGLTEGDAVAFRVKVGRDGSYRIMEICNTGVAGADCLSETSHDH